MSIMAEEGVDTKPVEETPNVQITEESAPPTAEGEAKPLNEEEQPKPIVEEPNVNVVPELNIIPESGNENTVITDITPNEPQEAKPTEIPADITPNEPQESKPTEIPEETSPTSPNKDVLDKALESAKAKPAPIQKSTIIREPGAPDLPPAANTIFILDLMKQREEKIRRKKKDDIIHEMALKMKKEKEEAKRKGKQHTYNYGSGGFLGVHRLTSEKVPVGKSPQLHRKVSK